MADETTAFSRTRRESRGNQQYSRFLIRAPAPAVSVLICTVVALVDLALVWLPGSSRIQLASAYVGVFLVPTWAAVALTPAVARTLGGSFSMRRSAFLALVCLGFPIPFLVVWRLAGLVLGPTFVGTVPMLLFVQGPILWFRHMSLFGVSNTHHGPSLPASLLQPLLSILGIALVFGLTPVEWLGAALFLVLGFLCAALLLRAADRPLRREFNVSGVAFIRPLLEHVEGRDPGATETLENFFGAFAVQADVRLILLQFRTPTGPKATIALPAVHPGPFAALGGSDLPRKLAEMLGPGAGVVFVPHTPCNHDLDLPTEDEVRRIGDAARSLMDELPAPAVGNTSPLVGPRPGSWARAQALGEAILVVASQAPEPTDDIAFAIADRLFDELGARGKATLALIDAHNSYREDEGDLPYASPRANRLMEDVRQAVDAACARARGDVLRLGVGVRTGYEVGRHGIGPHGIRSWVVETAGTRTAYVLIDGNNLVEGLRAPLLEALRAEVDAAEVMTTDNHVVHEVDGGVNAVGERYSTDRLREDVVGVVREAVGNLEAVELRVGVRTVPGVRVLGPDWTARLLTSLGDTLSMFSNALLMTFLLLLSSSAVVLVLLR